MDDGRADTPHEVAETDPVVAEARSWLHGPGASGIATVMPEGAIAPRTADLLRRWGLILSHRGKRWLSARGLLGRLFEVVAYIWLPAQAAFTVGVTWTAAVGICLLCVSLLVRAYKEDNPRNVEAHELTYDTRALVLTKLIAATARWQNQRPSATEIAGFCEDALQAIALYVRDYRSDISAKKIFANLLVPEGDHMVVLARDRPHRRPNARYPRKGLLAWRAFETCQAMVTGDLRKDYPNTSDDKDYRSVMVLPVLDDSGPLAVVSVDSTEGYHFDEWVSKLEVGLSPYLRLLATAITMRHNVIDSRSA